MPWARMHQPYLVLVVVDQVPDAGSAGDLDLPPVHLPATELAGGKIAVQRAVPMIPHAWPGAHVLPGGPGIARRPAAQLFPALGRLVVAEDDLPLAFGGRRGHAVTAPRAHLAGSGTGPQSTGGVVSAARMSGSAYASAVARHSRSRAATRSGACSPLEAASASSAARARRSSSGSGPAHGIARRRSEGREPAT